MYQHQHEQYQQQQQQQQYQQPQTLLMANTYDHPYNDENLLLIPQQQHLQQHLQHQQQLQQQQQELINGGTPNEFIYQQPINPYQQPPQQWYYAAQPQYSTYPVEYPMEYPMECPQSGGGPGMLVNQSAGMSMYTGQQQQQPGIAMVQYMPVMNGEYYELPVSSSVSGTAAASPEEVLMGGNMGKSRNSISSTAQCEILGDQLVENGILTGTESSQLIYKKKKSDGSVKKVMNNGCRRPLITKTVLVPEDIGGGGNLKDGGSGVSVNNGSSRKMLGSTVVSGGPIPASEVMDLIKDTSSNKAALELVMRANKANLNYIKSMKDDKLDSKNDTIAFADEDKAKEIMRRLNPSIKDEDKLFRILKDYVNGKEIDLSILDKTDVINSNTMLIPLQSEAVSAGGAMMAGSAGSSASTTTTTGGFHVSHQFVMRLKDDEKIEYMAVKIVESPMILAAYNLLNEQECLDLITLCYCNNIEWKDNKTSTMKLRLEDNIRTYYVPNDDDKIMNNQTITTIHRSCKSIYIQFNDYRDHPIYPFLKSLQLRASALCRCTNPDLQINGMAIERYEHQNSASFLHLSNQREGAIIISLSNGTSTSGGALSFPLAGIELIPKQGLAVFIPAVYPDTIHLNQPIPDPRTEFGISPINNDQTTIYYAVFYVTLLSSPSLTN